MGGDKGDLCTLDGWVPIEEAAEKDIVAVTQEVPIHHRSGGSWHVWQGRLVLPTLPCERYPDPVDDGTPIQLGSGTNDAPL